jgi:uncharacterized membrane protein
VRNAVLVTLTLLYPLAIYFGLGRFEPRWLALLLLGLAFVRVVTSRQRVWWAVAAMAVVLASATFLANAPLPLKLYPAVVSASLLALFAASLVRPPTAIERMARLTQPDLSPRGVAYTRKVTWVWCGFFLINGTVAAATARWGSDAVWALYNGLIAYGLMGLLFGIEWLVRQRVMSGGADV